MRLAPHKIKQKLQAGSLTLQVLLKNAGVSKTAYYSLLKQETLLPKSLHKLAKILQVTPFDLLEDPETNINHIRQLQNQLEKLVKKYPEADRENMWHTLLLLEEEPIERMKRGLIRGQNQHLHQN